MKSGIMEFSLAHLKRCRRLKTGWLGHWLHTSAIGFPNASGRGNVNTESASSGKPACALLSDSSSSSDG